MNVQPFCQALPTDLQLLQSDVSGTGTITFTVISKTLEAACPLCTQMSTQIHSSYHRVLQDLPWGGVQIRLRLVSRRFRCQYQSCPRRIFTERFKSLTAPHARRTTRCAVILRALCSATSGRGGARLAQQLQLPASAATLTRLLYQSPICQPPATIVGVDDFAFRRGQKYGTVIVNLETHRPIEILPDRSRTGLEHWLREHPEVRVMSRDRSTEFAAAARAACPHAVQVLDRWHLLKNLREVVERFLARHQRLLREYALPPKLRTHADEAARAARHARDKAFLARVQELRRQGLSIRAVARHLGCSRWLAKRYVHADAVPVRGRTIVRRSILDPYRVHLEKRWQQGCRNASLLWREVRELGYPGTRTNVAIWASRRRTELHTSTPFAYREAFLKRQEKTLVFKRSLPVSVSPQELTWLLWRDPTTLHEEEREGLATLTAALPAIAELQVLIHAFKALLWSKETIAVQEWLDLARTCNVRDLSVFAESLALDQAALEAAVVLPWSQGPVEGMINKIKLIKRQMYGRASFPTLRRRILLAFDHQL
jgi:transposase